MSSDAFFGNNFGLRDKVDQSTGLLQVNPTNKQFNVQEFTVTIDTRDCIGKQSLADAQLYSETIGKRSAAYGYIVSTTGIGVYPLVITLDSTVQLRNGDNLIIRGVNGNTNVNGTHRITNIVGNTAELQGISSNGNYKGGGTWIREADNGFPILEDTDPTIFGNKIIINLENKIRNIRELTLMHIVIPRDIIPITTYFSDFISVSTSNPVGYLSSFNLTINDYTTFIPQEKKYMEDNVLGFYSTNLQFFRSYAFGTFSPPDTVTPPPLQLWNPTNGVWPNGQPYPYPYQTVPTYRSRDFNIVGFGTPFRIILAGYGVYDLVDWTDIGVGLPAVKRLSTNFMRKLLLLLICPSQSFNNVDSISLILSCNVTSNDVEAEAFGFGDFQRYVPGPGVGQTYQPNTNTWYTNGGLGSGPPNVSQLDSPINFPNFAGNVWGPYDSPGDRFQKLGVRTIIQDLYLNGDLRNLNGLPIILPYTIPEFFYLEPTFGLNFSSVIDVTLSNVASTSNPNILNAMRIVPNGFGAANIRANGTGTTYTNVFQSAGGQGPSNMGTPSAWVNNGVYGGAASFTFPVAQGYAGPGLTPATASASDVGTGAAPGFRAGYYDLGPSNGAFLENIQRYINYVVNEVPDTDLIMKVEEALRDERSISTRSFNSNAILDCPIRLNLGSTSGTLQYIESLQSLVGNATSYWEKRYINPLSELSRMHISFYSYDGSPIPLEKMLQTRQSSFFLQLFIRVISQFGIDFDSNLFLNFLFDPSNPQLIGRVKRYFQIIFKVYSYQGTPPGIQPTSYSDLQNNFE
jgi:hypothetical protein